MVNGVEGLIVQDGEGAGGESADEEGAEEAGGVGDGEGVDFVPVVLAMFGEAGVGEGLVDDRKDSLEVGTSGDFGNNATVAFKEVDLGNDGIRKQVAGARRVDGVERENSAGGFVTGGFDGENVHENILYHKRGG